ncbi:cytochrome c oxidase subunit II [Flavisphingomonas formosensis]|uniref:cytochrome c oxidase subunit II n=1 Tax=Flavisphingomonas formosensis TaxID=861534 RepID=UPI0012FBFB2B|nr:cytochrome c oxidase subunit II [Sphingomonas formosensis]
MTQKGHLAFLLPLASCAGAQTPLAPAGDQAAGQYSLLLLMLWVCGILYMLVLGFLAMGLWRLRRGAPAGNEPTLETPSDAVLGKTLWIWAAIIVVGLLLLAGASFLLERRLAAAEAREALLVRVSGHQWWWRIAYRDPRNGSWIETANELHLPVGTTARIELGSADVIHSFWVPNVAGKMDVIPGRANAIDVTPRRIGWFRGQCAEFCGLQHAKMAFDVKVETPAQFAGWLALQARPAPAPEDAAALRGMEIVTRGACAMCHSVRGTSARGRPGPDLTHVASRRMIAAGTLAMNRGNLQGWIAQPQALKPGTLMLPVTLEPRDANAVAQYLGQLK